MANATEYLIRQRNEALDTLALVAAERDALLAERDALANKLKGMDDDQA